LTKTHIVRKVWEVLGTFSLSASRQ